MFKRLNRSLPLQDSLWMRLFIDVKGSDRGTWEGFQYVVNNRVCERSRNALGHVSQWLELERRGVPWPTGVQGDEMVVAVPMDRIGIEDPKNFTVDFKVGWIMP